MLQVRRRVAASILVLGLPAALARVPRAAAQEVARILLELDLDAMTRERLQDAASADEAAERSVAILRRRLQEADVAGALVEREGARRIRVTLPRAADAERARGLLARRGRMSLHLGLDGDAGQGADAVLLPGERDGRLHAVRRHPEMDSTTLADAQARLDSHTGEWVVLFRFDAEGSKRFAEVTRKAVGRVLAIVVDGRVMVAPMIRGPILGGQAMISGLGSAQDATQLAILLRLGALPAPLALVGEAGPAQGPDARR